MSCTEHGLREKGKLKQKLRTLKKIENFECVGLKLKGKLREDMGKNMASKTED